MQLFTQNKKAENSRVNRLFAMFLVLTLVFSMNGGIIQATGSGFADGTTELTDITSEVSEIENGIPEPENKNTEGYSIDTTPSGSSGGSVTVNVIAAKDGYDGWTILYPAQDGTTELTVSYEQEPTLCILDVIEVFDPDFDGTAPLTNNRPNTVLGYSRGTNGYGNWSARKLSSGSSSYTNISNFTTAQISDGDSVIVYLPFSSGGSAVHSWDSLVPLITDPITEKTPAERLQNLIDANLTWDKIKGTANTDIDKITANLASLPSNLDNYSISLTWTSSDTAYISNSGSIIKRPAYGAEPVTVTLTASASNGLMPNTNKYGNITGSVIVKTFELTLIPYTESDVENGKPAVEDVLDNYVTGEKLKYIGKSGADDPSIDPDDVIYDIQLFDPRYPSGKYDSSMAYSWESDNPDVIVINSMRAAVTRPAPGQPDITVNLTVRVSKTGYESVKTFTLTVKAVAQAEIDEVNAELDAVAAALTFDVIANGNPSAQAVKNTLKMVYRGLSYPNTITWSTSNSGESGIKIEWTNSDTSVITDYGYWYPDTSLYTPKRPIEDTDITFTATLTSFRLASYVQPRTVEIPISIRAKSESAKVTSITTNPAMDLTFDADTKIYDLTAPALAENVTITVNAEETGTLIKSGAAGAYGGELTFTVDLTSNGGAEVIIETAALDSDDTDKYTLNITRGSPTDNDVIINSILTAVSLSYKGTSGDWETMDMAAYGMAEETAGKTVVENARDAYLSGSTPTTTYERIITALTSLGVDASKVYAGERFTDDYLNFINKIYGIYAANEAIFGLIALNSGNYDDGFGLSRDACIDYLLKNKLTLGSGQTAWAIISGTADADIDTTAMAVAALAPYYGDTDVKEAIDGALAYLSLQQNASGHYGNSNSTAMVIIALSAMGKDSHTCADFIKSGKSLIDGLLSFKTDDNKFGYQDNSSVNALATEQGFRALIAYRGFIYAGNKAYSVYQFGEQTGDGTELTGETNPENLPPDPTAPKNVTVRVENLYNGATLIPETTVNVSGTHLDALKEALNANGIDPDDNISGTGFITSIMGVSSGTETGWMYALNGQTPSTMLTETKVAEGDELVMFFINWYESVSLTKFDSRTANVTAGGNLTLALSGATVDINTLKTVYIPLPEAAIYVLDADGNRVGEDIITNADGKATITFADEGIYTVTAKKAGINNATSLVPPLCTVTVTAASGGEPSDNQITVTISIGNWVSNAKYTFESDTVTVYDVFMKTVSDRGLTQSGAENNYVRSINGLAEFDRGPNSGWVYTVNGTYPKFGLKDCIVKDGDIIIWSYTSDYTQNPDIPSGGDVIPENQDNDTSNDSDDTKTDDKTVTNEITVQAEADSGGEITADINNKAIADALAAALESISDYGEEATGEIKVNVKSDKPEDTASAEINIPSEALKAIAENKNIILTIETDIGTITIDNATIEGLAEGLKTGEKIKMTVKKISGEDVNEKQRETVGSNPVIDLSVTVGESVIHNFRGEIQVTVSFEISEDTASEDYDLITVYHIDDNGNINEMTGAKYSPESKSVIFTTDHFSKFFISEWINPFSDAEKDGWYYRAVRYVYSNSLMNGVTEDKFAPNGNLTRGMLVTILYRYEGSPKVGGAGKFTDVADGKWYSDAIAWASDNGIVNGYGNGLFGVNDNVTREQFAAIIYRYAQSKKLDVSKTDELAGFTDAGKISEWALPAMKWAVGEGLVNGRTPTTIVPEGTAYRAEAAELFMRFIEDFVK